MLLCIGKIEDERRIEAVRLVDTETKEVQLISFKKVRKTILDGVKVKGFKLKESTNYARGNVSKHIMKEVGNFSYHRIPKLNGAGELLNPEDAKIITVYGWQGFAEAKKYHCFNYKGETEILDRKEFEQRVREKKVNGAMVAPRNGKVALSAELNIEL